MSSSHPPFSHVSALRGFGLLELVITLFVLSLLTALALAALPHSSSSSPSPSSSAAQGEALAHQEAAFSTLQALDQEMRALVLQDTQLGQASTDLTPAEQASLQADVSLPPGVSPPRLTPHGAFLAAGGVCYALQASLHFDSPATPSSDVVTTYGHIGLAASPADCS